MREAEGDASAQHAAYVSIRQHTCYAERGMREAEGDASAQHASVS